MCLLRADEGAGGRDDTVTPVPDSGASETKPISVLILNGFFVGHLFPLVSLGEELVKRGHNVTLCSTVMEGTRWHSGEVAGTVGMNFLSAGPDDMSQEDFNQFAKNISLNVFVEFMEAAYSTTNKIVTAMDTSDMDQFDIIVCDYSVTPAGIYQAVLGKPVIIFASFLPPFFTIEPNWPQLPVMTIGHQTFFDRLMTAIFFPLFIPLRWLAYDTLLLGPAGKLRETLEGKDYMRYPGVKVPLIMSTVIGIDIPNLLTPLKHYVGPVLKGTLPPLPSELEAWLDSKRDRSVIYVSMGTTGSFSDDGMRVMVEGILRTEYDVIWAQRERSQLLEDLVGNTSRFLIQGWVPQQSLLRHPSLLLTMHHCGFNTVQESLYNALPVVCLPHGFDQFQVGTIVNKIPVGRALYSMADAIFKGKNFTATDIYDAIEVAASNESVTNAQKISMMYKFAGGSKAAADLVEYYEDLGYDHLIPAFAKYQWTWVQYRNLDVYTLLLCVCGLSLFVFYKCCTCVCKCVCKW